MAPGGREWVEILVSLGGGDWACKAAAPLSLQRGRLRRTLSQRAMAATSGGWPGRAVAGVKAWLAAGEREVAASERGPNWAAR